MPTMELATAGVSISLTFESLIAERVSKLAEELTAAVEDLAKEREAVLKQENQELLKENHELRQHLDDDALAKVDAVLAARKAEGDRTTVCVDELAAANNEITAADELGVVETAAPGGAISTKEFHLLQELRGPEWDQSGSEHIQHSTDFVLADTGYTEHDLSHALTGSRHTRCFLDPASELRLCWDLFGIPVLSWDLITIPLQVFDLGNLGDDIMEIADWVTLFYWTLDMPASFITGYYDFDGNVVSDKKKIAINYLRGPFTLDCVIVFSDWVATVIELVGSSAPSALGNLAILRVMRISRFARLLRLRKLKSKLQTIEDGIDDEWLLVCLSLVLKVASILIINHYVSCIWFWIGKQKGLGGSPYRWLTSFPYPQYNAKDHGDRKLADADWTYQYLTALHWSIAQFTPGPHPIQPQNCTERVFAVAVLLFGLIVFSSFIASVTQARMQMSKMMSKFERDFWLLRKFCRQHKISPSLRSRMKRYIDLVVVPAQQKLNTPDVVLIPKLSPYLRSQLNTEIHSQCLQVHPFFNELIRGNRSVMDEICSHSVAVQPLACGDVSFVGGQVARMMYIIVSGVLDYIPISKMHNWTKLEKNQWIGEAALWTKWMHQGQLQASVESKVMTVDASKLREVLLKNGLVMDFVRQYGNEFCKLMTRYLRDTGMPSDMQEKIAEAIQIQQLSKLKTFLWHGLT